ncbi:MAG: hypothetical protein KGJ86_09835, partial [Chloroflexota bacterium]|nr:hypothetical protein [Chloroflexota bacterium]
FSRGRWLGPLLAFLVVLGIPVQPALASGCRFLLGFQELHSLDPSDVGDCTGDQSYIANGDAQQSTTKGLLVWRKADNWTAFTDGYHTWINGPQGLQERLNSQRFPWENPSLNEMEQDFLRQLNNDRQSNGLAPLALNQRLVELAEARARDQLQLGGPLSHYDGAGHLMLRTILTKNNIPFASAGENLAENNYGPWQTVTVANDGLMKSPTHRANILNPSFNSVGVAVVGPTPGGRYYYAQLFLQSA